MRVAALLVLGHILLDAKTEAASLGVYIRAGLGLSTTQQSSDSPISSSSATYITSTLTSSQYTNTTSASVHAPGNGNNSASLACLNSWSSYDAFSATAETRITVTVTTYIVTTVDITYGTGDVYTTSAGIPVASGKFTSTTVAPTVLNITTSSLDFTWSTQDPARLNATPTCSTIAPSECSNLYVTYLDGLGLAPNASVPSITPAPTNSPACPAYYYQPYSSCVPQSNAENAFFDRCTLSGANVQVFYFPPSSSNATASNANLTSQTVVQSYAPGITFTSPSIYLSFDYLSARSTNIAQVSLCTFCDTGGCATVSQGGYQVGVDDRGTTITGALLTLAPEDVSSVLYNYTGAQATSMVDLLAHAPIGVENPFINDIIDAGLIYNLAPKLLDLNSMTHPAPTDYYLNPGNVPGCDGDVVQPECHTIYEGLYRAVISLPSHASFLQGAWNTCVPIIFGAYDPPHALTEVSTIAGVSRYPGVTTPDVQQTTGTNGGASPTQRPSTTVPGPTSVSTASPTNEASPMDQNPPSEASSTDQTPPGEDATTSAPFSSPLASDAVPVQTSTQVQSGNAQSQQSAGSPNAVVAESNSPVVSSNAGHPQPETTTNALSVLESALTTSMEVVLDPATDSKVSVAGGEPTTSDQFATPVLSSGGAAQSGVVLTLGSQTVAVAPNNGGIVVEGQTIAEGGSLITSLGGQTYTISRASGGAILVDGVTAESSTADQFATPVSSSGGAVESDIVITLGSQTVTLAQNNGDIVVASQTIAQGDSLTTSIGGQSYTIAKASNGAIFVDGVTASQTALIAEDDGQTDVAVEIGTDTTPLALFSLDGGSAGGIVAALTTTVNNQILTISEASNGGVVVDGVTASRTALLNGVSGQATAVIEVGGTHTTPTSTSGPTQPNPETDIGAAINVGSTTLYVIPAGNQAGVEVVDGDISITAGGAPQVVAGVSISAGTSGVVEDGTFVPFSSITAPSPSGISLGSSQSHPSTTSARTLLASSTSAQASTSGAAAHLRLERSVGSWLLSLAFVWIVC